MTMRVEGYDFKVGELYLFSSDSPECLAEKCLWGIYDTTERGRVKLEVATRDLRMFTVNQLLDRGYHFVRPSTREELRDFCFNYGFFA